jgi:hypothetical protein
MSWACGTRGTKVTYIVLIGKPEGKDHLEDLGVDGRIILKLFLNWIPLHGILASGLVF